MRHECLGLVMLLLDVLFIEYEDMLCCVVRTQLFMLRSATFLKQRIMHVSVKIIKLIKENQNKSFIFKKVNLKNKAREWKGAS